MQIQQDASVFLGALGQNGELHHDLRPGRHGWIQLIRGSAKLNDVSLETGDGAAVSDEARVAIRSRSGAEILLFDLA
jgi:redox-sensitive bicupin YhaK (pirin superfamily)